VNRRLRALGGAALLAAAIAGSSAAVAASPSASPHDGHTIARGDLRRLREATAPFHRVERALASGRVDLELCFDHMGQHYADPATFGDGILDPVDPEALVYENVGNRLRLVAVEWVSTVPGEVLGIPLHLNESLGVYVLHAWIWKDNPAGMLEDFNRRVGNCP
jgi:hypothetical protein